MTDPRPITDLPAATVANTDDLVLLHQSTLDKKLTIALLLDTAAKKASNLADLDSASAARQNLGLELGVDVQEFSDLLDALTANHDMTGFIAQTATDTVASRTLQAPAAGFSITNPAGIAGDPTFVLANDLAALEGLSSAGFGVRTGADTWAVRSLVAPAAGFTISNNTGASGNPTFALANDLAAVEGLSSTGLATRTGTDTWEVRTLTGPAAGISVSNGNGVSGNPTLSLANDLAALEGLSSTGFAVRTASDTWAQRTLQAPAAGFSITNPAGIAGDPTFVLANDLGALEALSSTGIAVRTASDTWAQRTITGTANQVDVANGSGQGGDPTLSLPAQIILPSHASAGSIAVREASANGTNKMTLEAANNIASDFKLKFFGAYPPFRPSGNNGVRFNNTPINYPIRVDESGNLTATNERLQFLREAKSSDPDDIFIPNYFEYGTGWTKFRIEGIAAISGSPGNGDLRLQIYSRADAGFITSGYKYIFNGKDEDNNTLTLANSSASGILLMPSAGDGSNPWTEIYDMSINIIAYSTVCVFYGTVVGVGTSKKLTYGEIFGYRTFTNFYSDVENSGLGTVRVINTGAQQVSYTIDVYGRWPG